MASTGAFATPLTPSQTVQPLDVTQVDNTLSLSNGMTAGYGVNDGHTTNWPFDSRVYGNWPLQPIRVGLLRNIQGSLPPTPNGSGGVNGAAGQYTLFFMYNPNQIVSQFALNLNQAAPLYLYGDNSQSTIYSIASPNTSGQGGTGTLGASSAAVPNLANSQTVQWSLFFDRTYDMLYGANDGKGNPSDDRGVLKDVAALYNLMGTFLTDAAVPVSTPCEVVFGQNGAGQLWGFTGYISNVTITYGIFRHDMIPSRCEVDLTMTTTYVAQSTPAGGGSASDPVSASNPVSTPLSQFLASPDVMRVGTVQGPPPQIGSGPNNINTAGGG